METLTLTAEYRIPKLEISAEVFLLAHPQKTMKLFLHERAETHAGTERPSDLLNGPGEFFPAIEVPEKLVLLNRDAVTVISVPAESEFPPDPCDEDLQDTEQAAKVPLEVVIQGGTVVRGTVCFAMPEGRNRLVDFLNTPDRFLIVREEGFARLINKRRIVRVTLL